MDNAEFIRSKLTRIIANTAGAERVAPPTYWVGDRAGEKRANDDLQSGRVAWRNAQRRAQLGLKALDDGDLELAEVALWEAVGSYIAGLESRIVPRDLAILSTSAKAAGRREDALTARLVVAVAETGLQGQKGIRAALQRDPALDEACRDIDTAALARRISRAERKDVT